MVNKNLEEREERPSRERVIGNFKINLFSNFIKDNIVTLNFYFKDTSRMKKVPRDCSPALSTLASSNPNALLNPELVVSPLAGSQNSSSSKIATARPGTSSATLGTAPPRSTRVRILRFIYSYFSG